MVAMIPEIPDWIRPEVDRAALALSFGFLQADAGVIAGRSARTVRRWLQEPEFRELVEQYNARNLYALAVRIDAAQLKAAETVIGLTDSTNERVQLAAALALLDRGAKLREEISFARRTAALEQTAAAGKLAEENKKKKAKNTKKGVR
jgi:hypothetical protein